MIDIDVFAHPIVIGYPFGAGGNRLRRLLLGVPWMVEPKRHLHRINEVRKYTSEEGIPKFPRPDSTEVESQATRKYPVLTTHCMNSQVLRRVFPGRKIVKIYCDFYLTMRRHWVVYYKSEITAHIKQNKLKTLTTTDIQRYVAWSLDYYRDNIDWEHDHAVYIESGESEFADFMLKEFHETESVDFNRAWKTLMSDPAYAEIANLPMIQNARAWSQKP